MRIAISGTHFIGKSTLINDFISAHPEYKHEIEAYCNLQEMELAEQPSLNSILEQLDYSIEQLNQVENEQDIIFDRCPIDFIAYAMVILNEDSIDIYDTEVSERFDLVKEALNNLDLIVFLPISKENPIVYTEENPDYRIGADKCFKKIYRDDIFDVFPRFGHPKIIEISGERKTRLKILDSYLVK